MINLKFTLLCLSWFVAVTFTAKAPFIEKCHWDDEACLKRSSQKAIPYFTSGIPDLGLTPLDPLQIKEAKLNENGLQAKLKDFTVTRLKDCEVIDVKRDIKEEWLKFSLECPITAVGSYEVSGQLIGIAIEGNGPFRIETEKLRIAVVAALTYADGKDGEKHFKIGKTEKSFEVLEKTHLKFENLYNGDAEKAAPILTILDQNWKELVQYFASPVIDQVMNEIVAHIQKFADEVPASELEK